MEQVCDRRITRVRVVKYSDEEMKSNLVEGSSDSETQKNSDESN